MLLLKIVVFGLAFSSVHSNWKDHEESGRFQEKLSTVKDNPQLSDLKGLGTSKLDWRYF